MDNFDLRKYLAEGRLFEEENPVWTIDSTEDSADIEQAGSAYKKAVIAIIKAKHSNISSEDLEKSIEVTNDYWYDESRQNAKGSDPEDIKVSAEEFADSAIEYYEDALMPEPDDSKGWTPPADDDFDYWFNWYKEDFPGTEENDEGKVITDEKYKKAFINYVQKEIKPKFTSPTQIQNAIFLFRSKMKKDYGLMDYFDEPDFDLEKYL
jgi:hypothetical protein